MYQEFNKIGESRHLPCICSCAHQRGRTGNQRDTETDYKLHVFASKLRAYNIFTWIRTRFSVTQTTPFGDFKKLSDDPDNDVIPVACVEYNIRGFGFHNRLIIISSSMPPKQVRLLSSLESFQFIAVSTCNVISDLKQ
jgi:hypothetical protein